MHLEIIDQKRIEILEKLKTSKLVQRFSLGGGTGLSLQLGLRYSSDFDFFTNEHFDIDELLSELIDLFKEKVVVISKGGRRSTLDLFIDDVKLSFLEYNYENIRPLIEFEQFEPLRLLSIEDIACMKVIAINQRGTKKDFFDMYFIIQHLSLDAKKITALLDEKYKDKNVKTALLFSSTFFEEADNDILPMSFVNYSWEEIKAFFVKFQKNLLKLMQ